MHNLYVRRFLPSDAWQCCQIINRAAVQMDGLNPAALHVILSKNDPDNRSKEFSRLVTFVYEEQGSVLALGALDGNEIKRVYVDPSAQHKGIGSTIVRALEHEARKRQCSYLVIESQPNAELFYQQLGFQRSKEEMLSIGEAQFHLVIMKKDLTESISG